MTNNQTPVWWPSNNIEDLPSGVTVVTVNYNTKELIARLLWSLYRFLGHELRSVIVVDNGSSDGSVKLLQAIADADLCELIVNQQNCHHGPALSQGLSYLAQVKQLPTSVRPWVWLLDSDCIIARSDVMTKAISAAIEAKAALVGESYWNRWNTRHQFAGFSLLLDPAHAWRAEIGMIPNGGDPIGDFEESCVKNGVATLSVPFTKNGYLIHRGRSTLSAVREREETSNPLYEWAQEHYQPHFQEVSGAEKRYLELVDEFNRQVPDLHPDTLIQACQKM